MALGPGAKVGCVDGRIEIIGYKGTGAIPLGIGCKSRVAPLSVGVGADVNDLYTRFGMIDRR